LERRAALMAMFDLDVDHLNPTDQSRDQLAKQQS